MSTFSGSWSTSAFLMWTLAGFLGALPINSFIEWAAHRFVLHSKRFISFAYELHHVGHHGMFGSGESYHASTDHMRAHIAFVPRDYVLFVLATTPLWIGAELLIARPVLLGGILATLFGLQMFNSLHYRFHAPKNTWLQRTKLFLFLKEHHRRHHGDTTKNFNVYAPPLADWIMGTLKK